VPLLLIGCSENRKLNTSSEVDGVALVRDNIFKSTYASSWSLPAAKGGSSRQAKAYCNNQGKEFVFRSSNLDYTFMTHHAYVYFSCVGYNDSSLTAQALREKQRGFERGQRIKSQWISSYNESVNEKKRIKAQERLRKREVEALESIQYNLRKLNDKGYDCRIANGRIRCD
jgi:hypothetical protein